MIATKGILSVNSKIIILNVCRFLQTTEVSLFRVNDGIKLRRMGQRLSHPLLREKPAKDSAFVEMENENYGDDGRPNEDFLEEVYNEEKRKFERTKPGIKYRSKKDTIAKRAKEPNMLTTNERQHMIFLHQSDPVEWDERALSESFPALPWMVKKILKQKWNPDNEEKMKLKDEQVLENWGKLKENKLDASPEFLEHLKKFADRRENLEVQLKNPNYFHLPEVKKETPWVCGGFMKSMLVKYEKDLEQLKKNDENVIKSLPRQSDNNETSALAELTSENGDGAIRHTDYLLPDIKMAEDTGLKYSRKEKHVTLDALKKRVFDKSENKKHLISPAEEQLIQKTLSKNSEEESPKLESKENTKQEAHVSEEKEPKPPEYMTKRTKRAKDRAERLKYLGIYERDSADMFGEYANAFDAKKLGTILFKDNKTETETVAPKVDEAKVQKKKTVNPVNYFNTEKDKLLYDDFEKLLEGTAFWNQKKRNKSLDAGSLGARPAEDLSHALENYQTYDYPETIKIPEDKRIEGKLYKVRDCYYDDNGKFLYRVPGMVD